MQLGPDGRIYIVKSEISGLAVINNPDQSGDGCNYEHNGLPLTTSSDAHIAMGLPNIIDSDLFRPALSCSTIPIGNNQLDQNEPNPVDARTVIRYTLAEPGMVLLELFDVAGHKVLTIHDGYVPFVGENEAIVDGRDLPSGSYCYRINIDGWIAMRSLTVLR